MNLTILFLFLPQVFAQKDILVKVEIRRDLADLEVETSGEDDRVITDDEMHAFNINKSTLKDSVWKLTNTVPDEIFFKNPNSTCNIYTKKGWSEVKRKLEPERRTILSIQSKSVVIASKEFTNNSTKIRMIDADFTENIEHSIRVSWGNFTVDDNSLTKIKYKVMIEDSDFIMFFSSLLGKDTQESQPVSIQRNVGRNPDNFIKLGPKETVTVALVAHQILINLQIEYEVEFEGDIACYYRKQYRGKKFKKYDIEKLLEIGNLSKEIKLKQYLQYKIYLDVKTVVKRGNYIDDDYF